MQIPSKKIAFSTAIAAFCLVRCASAANQPAELKAEPNPIKVCDSSGTGVTELSWSSSTSEKLEVHVGSPDGKLFAESGAEGKEQTGKWVTEGMTFYLQNVAGGLPLSADNTLAKLTVNLTKQGCQ